jgi:ankyrin repeat protein
MSIQEAIEKNDIERVKELIPSLNNFQKNNAMVCAAENGHIDIVRLMIEKGTKNFHEAITHAALYGHIEIVKLMIEKGVEKFEKNNAMWVAARHGHIDIARLMIEHRANNFNEAMGYATRNGHIDIVRLMIEHGANNFNGAMWGAAYHGHIDIAVLLFQYFDNKEEKFKDFVVSGNYEIVSALLSYVSDSLIHDCIEIAREKQHYDIVSLLSTPVYRTIHDNFEETRR